MVEIIVPYGDPRSPFQHKCAFDVMDYGLGATANSLELGCDCLGHIKYFDGMVNNSKGVCCVCALLLHANVAGIACMARSWALFQRGKTHAIRIEQREIHG